MRRLFRKKLSAHAAAYLDKQTARILAAPQRERKTLAKKLFKQAKKTKAFAEIRSKLRRMSPGRRRCMYCEDSMGVHIDHFWPLSRFPRKTFRWTNYLSACSYCDSHKKGDNSPLAPIVNRPLLIKPTKDEPRDHLLLTPSTGRFEQRSNSPMGEKTIEVFGLNARAELTQGRRDAWLSIQALLIQYAEQRRKGNDHSAGKVETSLRRQSFSCVFVYLLDIASSSSATLLQPKCLAAIHEYPEIKNWLGRLTLQ